jgi:DnaK suppressor protein
MQPTPALHRQFAATKKSASEDIDLFAKIQMSLQMRPIVSQIPPSGGQLFQHAGPPMARKDFIKKMADVLIERRDALRQAVTGDDSLLKELSQRSDGDVVDFASASATGELSSQLAEVETRELNLVEEALKRVKDGTFGKCKGCKRNIKQARMQALPYAACCIECKRAAEQAGVEPNSVVDWSSLLNPDFPAGDLDANFS